MAKLKNQIAFLTVATLTAVAACGGSDSPSSTTAPQGGGGAASQPAGPNCGDGQLNPDEQCDKDNLAGSSCSAATMGSAPAGILGCNPNCTFDTTGCTSNGVTVGTAGATGTGGGGGGFAMGGRVGRGGRAGRGGAPAMGTGGG